MKRSGLIVMVIFLLLAIASLVMYFNRKNATIHPDEVIEKVTSSFKKDLKVFLNTVNQTSTKIKQSRDAIDVDSVSKEDLNRYFSALIKSEKNLAGAILFGKNNNYVIIVDQNSFIVTYNSLGDSLINWERYDFNLKKTGGWIEAYNEFMDDKNFGSIKAHELVEHDFIWRSSQSAIPERRHMLFSVFRIHEKGGNIAALVYRTTDLGNRFTKVLQFSNPLVSVITTEGGIVTPMRTTDTTEIAFYEGLSTTVHQLVNTWDESGSGQQMSYTFDEKKQEYWCRIDTLTPVTGVDGFAVTISKKDLVELSKKVEQAYLYAVIMFLLIALFTYLTSSGKFSWAPKRANTDATLIPREQVKSLIEKGETEHVEFKSSLRWDFREEKPNKILEDVILKSIAAFSNAKGGILFIGVTDDLEIIGLEHDFKTLKKQDVDYFELHLRKLINNQYGIRYSNKHLVMQFHEFDGKTICVINITSSENPLYLKTKNKQGHEVEKFYVRSGNASQEITSLKEINEYISANFHKG